VVLGREWFVEAMLASLKAIFTLAANSMTNIAFHAAVRGMLTMHERQVLFLLWARKYSSWNSLFFSQCGFFAKIGTLQLATGLDPLLE
jgi:hypothetical protein